MKNYLFIGTLLLGFLANAQIKVDKNHFIDLLQKGKYQQTLDEATAIRKKEYGKCETIDYFIAKSLCGLGFQEKSKNWYASMLKYYKLNPKSRSFISNEMNSCGMGQPAIAATSTIDLGILTALTQMELPESGSRGKGGTSLDCSLPPQAFTSMEGVSQEELESRLFLLNQGPQAVAKYKAILGNSYNVRHLGRFVIITYGQYNLNNEDLKAVCNSLQRAFDFYVSHYKLRPPDKLLTVFLLPTKYQLRITAQQFHGIKIPDSNLGYSNIGDLSLLGVSNKGQIGTLTHELFHLMVRTDVGDAPPWLDEGIASVYEQSYWDGNVLLGEKENWRLEQLKTAKIGESMFELGNKVPTLHVFINFTWDEFDGLAQNDRCIGALNYAYGRSLMIFLQEKNKLADMFIAMKTRSEISSDGEIVLKSSTQIFEQVLGMPLAAIENEFDEWLWQLLQTNRDESSWPSEAEGNNMQVVQTPVFAEQVISNQAENSPNVTQSQVLEQPVFDPNEILNSLEVHVLITDQTDENGQRERVYYVSAPENIMNIIQEVHYQRNHSTFPEKANNTFISSADAQSFFSFKAFQWGDVRDVSIYITLKDGATSAVKSLPIMVDGQ